MFIIKYEVFREYVSRHIAFGQVDADFERDIR